MNPSKSIEIIPVTGMKEVGSGQNVGQLIVEACRKNGIAIKNRDVVVVTHKIISKAEGRVLELSSITPSSFARKAGLHIGKDPRQVEVILAESRRLVKMVRGLIIAETSHGFVCANAGVDQSNVDSGENSSSPQKARRIGEENQGQDPGKFQGRSCGDSLGYFSAPGGRARWMWP